MDVSKKDESFLSTIRELLERAEKLQEKMASEAAKAREYTSGIVSPKTKLHVTESPLSEADPDLHGAWEIGKWYQIRTVTMIHFGKLIYIDQHELVLDAASWLPNIGRFAGSVLGSEIIKEAEAIAFYCIIGRNSIVDATRREFSM